MTVKTILLPLLEGNHAGTATNTALHLAQIMDAHVHAVALRQRPMIPASSFHPYAAPVIDSHFAEIEEAETTLIKKLREEFDATCTKNNRKVIECRSIDTTKASFSVVDGHMPDRLASYARTSDISVMPQTGSSANESTSNTIAELIFQSARPVLVASADGGLSMDHCVVAWDGSREAAAGLKAAQPFLSRGGKVTILTIGSEVPGAPDAHDVVLSLAAQNISATSDIRDAQSGQRDFEQCIDILQTLNATLLIMGGYSHNRWREMILGGFTQKMLKAAPCPVLIAH